ncbi:MAG: hypothetical protein KGK08_07210 [Acidobacteriota bacterium]|nr:hypothetical protein [Acidobacteriota bacterium]
MGTGKRVVTVAAATLGLVFAWQMRDAVRAATPLPAVHSTRQRPDDLELDEVLPGASEPVRRFVAYADLLQLPQVAETVTNDENFTEMNVRTIHVTGIPLSELLHLFGGPGADMVSAVAVDAYSAPYPAEYIAAHHPLLVLKIEGLEPAVWAKQTHNEDPGPYLVTQADFVPSYHVLAHQERAQVPTQVNVLVFAAESEVFGRILPPPQYGPQSPQVQGYLIARQNCIRCHNEGATGGSKAGHSWQTLAHVATRDAATFGRIIVAPRSVNPRAQMPANAQYDAPTLAALTAYFQSIATK